MTPEEKNLLAKIWQSIRKNQAASYSHVFMDDLISLVGIIDKQSAEIKMLRDQEWKGLVINKKRRKITAKKFDFDFDSGKDITQHLDLKKAKRPAKPPLTQQG